MNDIEQARAAWMRENAGADIPGEAELLAWSKARASKTWQIVEEGGEYDLELVLGNPEYEGTDRDVRLVVTWREADDEPEVTTVYPCRECGWTVACSDGCHS